jgi:hypothetical protein
VTVNVAVIVGVAVGVEVGVGVSVGTSVAVGVAVIVGVGVGVGHEKPAPLQLNFGVVPVLSTPGHTMFSMYRESGGS